MAEIFFSKEWGIYAYCYVDLDHYSKREQKTIDSDLKKYQFSFRKGLFRDKINGNTFALGHFMQTTNKIKVALFDVDGIFLTRREYPSVTFSREYSVPMDLVNEFFMGGFEECKFGRADIRETVAPYLVKWNWQGTVEDFLEYWFKTDSNIVPEALALVDKLRASGIKCFMASRQEKYRMNYIINELDLGLKHLQANVRPTNPKIGLGKHFDGSFCSCDIGVDKNNPKFFERVMEKLETVRPEEIIFFDDKQENVETAKSVGINAYFYEGVDTIKNSLTDYL